MTSGAKPCPVVSITKEVARSGPIRGGLSFSSFRVIALESLSELTSVKQLPLQASCAVRCPMLAFHYARETTSEHFMEFAGIVA
jgi:hypothetical protein